MATEGHFKTRDGVTLLERRWDPEGERRGHLVLLHGYGEHCGRYGHVADALNRIGLAVYTYDQRGHGRSPGRRGYIRDFERLVDDLGDFLDHLGDRLDDAPRFVMGHSMGGLVLTRYVQTRSLAVRGLVFSSPFLAINDDVSPVLIALAGVLGTLTPWLPVASMDTTGLDRDADVVAAYENDPLVFHGRILARTGAQLNATIRRARAEFEAINHPLYVIHGADDRLVPAEGSRLLYDRCTADDKTQRIYEGGYHELLNDLDRDTVLTDLCAWLEARL